LTDIEGDILAATGGLLEEKNLVNVLGFSRLKLNPM
jgi:hypothetical protein